MSIKPVSDTSVNLNTTVQTPSLIQRIIRIIEKNDDASQEAQVVTLCTGAGTVFGLFARSAVMLSRGTFSKSSLLFYGLFGAAAGALVSSTAVISFFSNLKNREAHHSSNFKNRAPN